MSAESQQNKTLARELRATHFVLGDNAKNPFLSIFQKDYTAKSASNKQQHAEQAAYLREAHFNLGNNQVVKNQYKTTNIAQFPAHSNYEPATLNDEKKKDLRTHHFSFGKTDGATISHAKEIYKEHPLQANKGDLEEARARMRANNHNFRETNTKYMSSLYNQEYNKEYDKNALTQGYTKDQLMERVVELRNSHIVFGNHQLPMKTLQQQSYGQKENPPYSKHYSDFQATHIQFGQFKGDFSTTNTDFHQPLPPSDTKMDKDLIRQLQATHWSMGQVKPQLNSEFQMQYKPQQLSKQQQNKINTEQLQENHFSLGDPAAKNNYASNYQREMKPYENAFAAQPVIEKNKTNFLIGDQGNYYTTDFKANFRQPPEKYEKAELNKDLKSNLQNSHFKFSDMKNGLFCSTQKASYTPQAMSAGGFNEINQRNLRQTHFTLGDNGNNQQQYCTEFQAKYTKKDGHPNAFNEEKLATLRETHFQLG